MTKLPMKSTESHYRETVSGVGIIMTKTLPFTTKNELIKVFRQALSLDEVCELFIENEGIADG